MLTREQRKYLRGLAHDRNIIVRVGQNGLTDNVLDEINLALEQHELVKTGIRVGDRSERDRITSDICRLTGAVPVQQIGNTVVLYRQRSKDPVIALPG